MYDALDIQLIHALENDGDRTQAELGRILGASEATIRRRERKLKEVHALKISGIPNLTALGFDLIATLGMNVDFGLRTTIISSLVDNPNVRYVASCTGRFELFVTFIGRSHEELSQFLEMLAATPGVMHVETFLNLKTFKNRPWMLDGNAPAARIPDRAEERTVSRQNNAASPRKAGTKRAPRPRPSGS